MPITPDGFYKRMERIRDNEEPIKATDLAEELIDELLCQLGYGRGMYVFENMAKGYRR